MPDAKLCSIPDCGKPHLARGYCTAHYKRWKRNGDPNIARRAANGTTPRWIEEVALPFRGDQCLFWPFRPDRLGRAVVTINGKTHYVARMICEAVHGEPPTSQHEAAHSCGNGHLGCVNSRHLRWATHRENMDDAVAHGTMSRGELCGTAKLTEEEVREIRSSSGKISHENLARHYGISRSAITNIINRKLWAWLD